LADDTVVEFDRSINVRWPILRKALDDDADNPKYIGLCRAADTGDRPSRTGTD